MSLDLTGYRRQLARIRRGEPLPQPADPDPDRALKARRDAAGRAEQDRLERVKQLAPKAKQVRREAEAAARTYRGAQEAVEQAERARDEAHQTHTRLSNRLANLEYGTDLDADAA